MWQVFYFLFLSAFWSLGVWLAANTKQDIVKLTEKRMWGPKCLFQFELLLQVDKQGPLEGPSIIYSLGDKRIMYGPYHSMLITGRIVNYRLPQKCHLQTQQKNGQEVPSIRGPNRGEMCLYLKGEINDSCNSAHENGHRSELLIFSGNFVQNNPF